MITTKQKKELKEYQGNYGVDTHQKILFDILNENNLIHSEENVEVILDILLNEDFPNIEDETLGNVVDYHQLQCEPTLIRKIIDYNYEQYLYGNV